MIGIKFFGRKHYTVDDFMGKGGKSSKGPRVAASLQELETKLHMMTAMVNSRFKKPDAVEEKKLRTDGPAKKKRASTPPPRRLKA